jgi:hypothetical protein
MRAFLAILMLSSALPACTPYIPVKDGFGTTALAPKPGIPPEFAEFNNYDPSVNPLLAQQICATAYQPLEARAVGAMPGNLIEARGRCQTHVPLYGGL